MESINHHRIKVAFRKALFLCLSIIPFYIFSENSFATTGYEQCKQDLPSLAAECHEYYAWCLSEYGSQSCGPIENLRCETAPQCLYLEGSACKHAQLLIVGPSYWGNIPEKEFYHRGYYYGDENCIEPKPDQLPIDPLADQFNPNEVSSPNECRGE